LKKILFEVRAELYNSKVHSTMIGNAR